MRMAPASGRLLFLALTLAGCNHEESETAGGGSDPAPGDSVPTVARSAAAEAASAVEAETRNVDFHIDSGIVLHIARLRGQLLRSRPGTPPALDDKQSFIPRIVSAEIAIDTVSLSTLLNRHVFGYRGSPLRDLQVGVDGDQLVQWGVLRQGVGLRFTIRSTVALTADGQIRLHPTSVKVLGLKVRGLMKAFGVHLDQLMRLEPGHGARIEGDDFILDPTGMLPPPAIRGRLTAIRVVAGRVAQTFGPVDAGSGKPLRRQDSSRPNYMYFQHGTLRFGRLTMRDADPEIDDSDPATPFDFSLDRYNDQLVAGYSKSTADHGLVVHMPDLRTLHSGAMAPRRLSLAR